MNEFLKATAGVLTALILYLCLNKHSKDSSILLTLAVCAMVLLSAMSILRPVLAFLERLQEIGDLDTDLLSVLLKAVGIGMIAEISMLICKDAGNESMGKTIQMMATAVVLWISIPVFDKLLSLMNKILGSI